MLGRTVIVIAVAPLLVACSRAAAPVPVQGPERAISQLAGEWLGEYHSDETGRSGSIRFRLRADADTAEGDVIMTQSGAPHAMQPADARHAYGQQSEMLTIRFVEVTRNEVYGMLDPYRSPDCGCTLTTTFRGTLVGDMIQGFFETRGTGIHHPTQHGVWHVKRQP